MLKMIAIRFMLVITYLLLILPFSLITFMDYMLGHHVDVKGRVVEFVNTFKEIWSESEL